MDYINIETQMYIGNINNTGLIYIEMVGELAPFF